MLMDIETGYEECFNVQTKEFFKECGIKIPFGRNIHIILGTQGSHYDCDRGATKVVFFNQRIKINNCKHTRFESCIFLECNFSNQQEHTFNSSSVTFVNCLFIDCNACYWEAPSLFFHNCFLYDCGFKHCNFWVRGNDIFLYNNAFKMSEINIFAYTLFKNITGEKNNFVKAYDRPSNLIEILDESDVEIADYTKFKSMHPQFWKSIHPDIVPKEGGFTAYKKLADIGLTKDIIAKLWIPAEAKRVNGFDNKCRAEKAIVLEMRDEEGNEVFEGRSIYEKGFFYKKNHCVECIKDFDDTEFKTCTSGIHFFMTEEEAKNYNLSVSIISFL